MSINLPAKPGPQVDQALFPSHVAEASMMIDLFQVFDVRSINLTVTDEAGNKKWFKRYKSIESFHTALPALLLSSQKHRLNRHCSTRPSASFVAQSARRSDFVAS